MNAKAECPACSAMVSTGPKPRMGQRLKCGNCGTELEVVWLDPVELDWPYDEEEEFEEDYEEASDDEPY